MSISYDVTLPNGKSTRNPNIDSFFDEVCEKLRCSLDVYNKNLSTESHSESRKILNLIETGILLLELNIF